MMRNAMEIGGKNRQEKKACRIWCDGTSHCPKCSRNKSSGEGHSAYERFIRKSIWKHLTRRERRQNRQLLRISFPNGALS
jgi:hypothetical protein